MKGLSSDASEGCAGNVRKPKLTVEELEKRVAPAVADKKAPIPPPYAPGTLYGLVRRSNLRW